MTPQRILVVRLDRIGDVVLSTPVLQALREAYPSAFIAMMVRRVCTELVEGNPYINEVITYDKDRSHRGFLAGIRLAVGLREWRFDTALVLHPTLRSHLMVWLAGIPVRIGYDRKGGRLLTHRMPHRKQEGQQHEADYTLEMVRTLGLTPGRPQPFVPVLPERDRRVGELLASRGVKPSDVLVAVHPSASCVSKRWMPERFAYVADRLIKAHGVTVILVGGAPDAVHARTVETWMAHQPINLAGALSLGELACLLKRCRVLISNDSGPVHIAAAVGTPVVAIFGRNERGLSSGRWGPLGPRHVVLRKDVGCTVCLAHNCDIHFLCLQSLNVEEVYRAALPFLSSVDAPRPE